MKKNITVTFILALFFSLFAGLTTTVTADEGEFRVGMEAGYAPFNWSQQTDANGAIPIEGTPGAYAGGYDVEIAKKIAEGLGRKLVIVQLKWDGLAPAVQSGKIDAIIAGMSPTAERRKEVDFTNAYYESHLVIVVNKNGQYANAKSLADFKGAKITAQVNTFHYTVIDQIPGVSKEQAMDNFSAMRTALASNIIDGYVSERPEGVTAAAVDKNFKMIDFEAGQGFTTDPEDVQVAVGLKKNSPDLATINQILSGISSDEQTKIMDQAIENQPAATDEEANTGFFSQVGTIIQQNGRLFLQGAGLTLAVALFGTVVGTLIGLLIGVFRTLPESENPVGRFLQKVGNLLLTIYIQVFRGTPMMVQAMVIFYGLALAFGISLDKTVAGLLIVSINTGAYMSEIVRGGIYAVDNGQFEAAQAIGMTHGQTMSKIVLPQVLRNILPATGNEFVINIKDTAVLSVIGFADLFFQGNVASGNNFQFFQTFTVIGAMYLVMTLASSGLLTWMEKKMDGPSSYVQADNAEIENEER